MLKELENKIDEVNVLNDFLNHVIHNNVIIISNGNECPVPNHLLTKWYKDLRDHQEKLVREMFNGTE